MKVLILCDKSVTTHQILCFSSTKKTIIPLTPLGISINNSLFSYKFEFIVYTG